MNRPGLVGRGMQLVVRPDRVEASLWRRLRDHAETLCRDRLCDLYAALPRSLARRHARRMGWPVAQADDLEQAGLEGLLAAIARFDPERGVPFGAYARPRVDGSIRTAASRLTENGAMASFRRRVERDRLASLAKDAPSSAASAIDQLSDIAVQLALSVMLDGTVPSDDCTPGDDHNGFDSLAWRQLTTRLGEEVNLLPDQERTVVLQHYGEERLFAEIGKELALTGGRISQIHRAALTRLANRLALSR
jgi:RNA polymerase sigma factor FliA